MTYRRLSATGAAAIVLSLCALAGCGSVGPMNMPPDGGAESLGFDATGVLTLAPKQTATLDLSAAGISNATLSLAGNYLDAFLDADAVDSSSGHGGVTLHAPSAPTTFSIFATAASASARLDVAVSSTGFASVRVTVAYQGKRAVSIVAASAFVETTCAQLGSKAVDGAPLVPGTFGDPLVLEDVPTDGQVAVKVRIAHYATGCVDVPSLTAGEIHDVTVNVFDLPLDLQDSSLETRFTFTPDVSDEAALDAYFADTVDSAVLNASFPSSTNEAVRLLDAMSAASGSTLFQTARTQKYWDSAAASWLSQHGPSMHALASQWLGEAAQAPIGDLTGHLEGDAAKPVFTPGALGPLDAATAGVSAPLPFVWTGQPNDVLSLSGGVSVLPSQLACAEADLRAQNDVPSSLGVADAIATSIDCAGLASNLVPQGYAFGQCDAGCVEALCVAAVGELWTAGADALAKPSDSLTLAVSVAAPAQVVDTPKVQSYAGGFVGAFAYGTSQIATKGVAKGAFGTTPN